MDGQGYGTMNGGDGKVAKRNRSMPHGKILELEAFYLLLNCFCTRTEEENYHCWFFVAEIGKLELLCVAFSFFEL